MEIVQQSRVTDDLVNAMSRLLPQLSSSAVLPTFDYLEQMICSENVWLFTAEDNGEIVGALTLVAYRIPTGRKAWIEDVVVDRQHRGRRVGEMLVKHAIEFTRSIGIEKLDLTSTPSREVANKLYLKMGFVKRETNVYRYKW